MMKSKVSYKEFSKMDIRVGKVISAKRVEKSDNLICLQVSLGDIYGVKTILTGIAKWYKPDQLLNRKYLFLANLESRKLLGEESQGMILAAEKNNRAYLFALPTYIKEGAKVL